MLCSPLREMEILEIFVDAAWEAVRDDNPSEEAYEKHLYLNNSAVDFERGTIRTNQRLERGQPILVTKTWAYHRARQGGSGGSARETRRSQNLGCPPAGGQAVTPSAARAPVAAAANDVASLGTCKSVRESNADR